MNLKAKFNLASACLILIVVVGMMGSLYVYEKKQVWQSIEDELVSDLNKYALVYDESMHEVVSNELIFLNYTRKLILSPKIHFAGIIELDGSGWIHTSAANSLKLTRPTDPSIQDILKSTRILRRETTTEEGEGIIEMSKQVPGRGYVRLGYSKNAVDAIFKNRVGEIFKRFAIVGFIAILFGLLMATLFSTALSRPIVRLMRAAEAIGKGKKGVQIPENGREDEMGRLTHTFNTMSSDLTKLDSLKDDFMSHVTHELRSPLTTIIATVELMNEMPTVEKDAKLHRSVNRLIYGSERLNKLVDNILDLTRMEAGKMHFDIQPFDIKTLMAEMADFFVPRAAEKNLTIKAETEGDFPFVMGDAEKVRQIYSNLIYNAIKFTNEGGITLSLRKNGDTLEMLVKDTGVGIPKDKLPTVFDKFQTLGDTKNRVNKPVPGSGLGLNIVKNSIAAQNGKIWAESEMEKGSTFIFTLPIAKALPKPKDVSVETNGKGLKIFNKATKMASMVGFLALLLFSGTSRAKADSFFSITGTAVDVEYDEYLPVVTGSAFDECMDCIEGETCLQDGTCLPEEEIGEGDSTLTTSFDNNVSPEGKVLGGTNQPMAFNAGREPKNVPVLSINTPLPGPAASGFGAAALTPSDCYPTNVNTPITLDFSSVDADGDTLTYAVMVAPTNGSLSTSQSGNNFSATYTPNPGFNGRVGLVVEVEDSNGGYDAMPVCIDVGTLTSAPPTINRQNLTTPFETNKDIVLAGSDPDSAYTYYYHASVLDRPNRLNGPILPVDPATAHLNPIVFQPYRDFGKRYFAAEVRTTGTNEQAVELIFVDILPPPAVTGIYDRDPDLPGAVRLNVNVGGYGNGIPTVINASGLPDGPRNLWLKIQDLSGNYFKAFRGFFIDNTKPVVVVTLPSQGTCVNGPNLQIHGTASDNNAVAEVAYKIGSGVYSSPLPDSNNSPSQYDFVTTPPINTLALPDGNITFTFNAVDEGVGNSAEVTHVLKVDNTAPALTLKKAGTPVSLPGSMNVTGDVVLDVNASDLCNVTNLELRVTPNQGTELLHQVSGPSLSYIWKTATDGWVDGSYTMTLVATDSLGQTNTVSLTAHVSNPDNEFPVVSITNPLSAATVSGTVAFNATASDNKGVSKVEFLVDGFLQSIDTVAPYSYSWDTTARLDGPAGLIVKAYDAAGNVGSDAISVTVDNAAGSNGTNLTLIAPANNQHVKGVFTIAATATDIDGIDRLEFWVNGSLHETSLIAPYQYNWDTTLETNGVHTVLVRAYDTLGNSTDRQISVVVDNIIPSGNITAPTDGGTITGSVQVDATATDNEIVEKVEFLVGGVVRKTLTSGPYSWVWDTTQDSNGLHTVSVRVTDKAGNQTTHQITSDVQNGSPIVPPSITLISPQNPYVRGLIQLNTTVSGSNLDRVEFLVNAVLSQTDTSAPYQFDFNTTLETDSPKTITAILYNTNGDSASDSIILNVDNKKPSIVFTDPDPAAASLVISGFKTFKANATDVGGEINAVQFLFGSELVGQVNGNTGPYQYVFDSTQRNDGTNRVMIAKAIDRAGNTATTLLTFSIDNSVRSAIQATAHPKNGDHLVTLGADDIYFTFSGGIIPQSESSQVIPRSEWIKVSVTRNGETRPVAGVAEWVNNRLVFRGEEIKPNSEMVEVTLMVRDDKGLLVTKQARWGRMMNKDIGGEVYRDYKSPAHDGRVSLVIPAGALKEHCYVIFEDKPVGELADQIQQADVRLQNFENGQTLIAGPYEVFGRNAAGERIRELNKPAALQYRELSVARAPGSESQVVQLHRLDGQLWRPLGDSGQDQFQLSNGGQVRSVSVAVLTLDTFRVTALVVPANGIGTVFNFPNPFSPGNGGTNFHYVLGRNSEVKFLVYDVFGNLAKEFDIAPGAPGGRQGQNIFAWDGRNGSGVNLANGTYTVLMVVKDDQGNTYRVKRKVAVVK